MSDKTTPWTAADIPNLKGRTAVVTGASAGLGLVTARLLAEAGARVVLACRDIEKAAGVVRLVREKVPEAELSIVQLDLASQESVREAALKVRAECERIDLLINNAGTMSPQRIITADGFEATLATNYLGHFAFTGLLLDLLLAAPSGRVISLSSGFAGKKSAALDLDDLFYAKRKYKLLAAYGQSKRANLLFSFELQRRLNGTETALVSVAAHPGAAFTEFNRNVSPIIKPLTNPRFDWLFRGFMQSAEMGALPTLRAATDPQVRGGEFFGPENNTKGYPIRIEADASAHDPDTAGRLWAEAQRLTGVEYDFGTAA
ncbi:oxidoreductase [Nocardia jejuensis]|uniref:oxidoreductase n=1 Tax=Nocardia jejuensis TaxID=328049 RepID=UPI00082D51D0|nr:oxidoreductase [Nocardia jejuensis]